MIYIICDYTIITKQEGVPDMVLVQIMPDDDLCILRYN